MKLALPKGGLLKETAALLKKAGVGIDGYNERSRNYRLKSSSFPHLFFKVFQERDIPIQVAIGNYDLGICGVDWVEELSAKYPSSNLVKVMDLGYGKIDIYAVTSVNSGVSSVGEINNGFERVRIVSEYQNLAESFALRQRLRRFSILPIYGAGEVYPPESADLAIIADAQADGFAGSDLIPLAKIITSRAFLIANRNGLLKAKRSELLTRLQTFKWEAEEETDVITGGVTQRENLFKGSGISVKPDGESNGKLRLALPDGHLWKAASEFLDKIGLNIQGYSGKLVTRRPTIDLPGVIIKVIRPQDMPLQVANGNFDLAITGEDWLKDHLCRFPSSPVKEILKLGFGKVTVVAVVSEDLATRNVHDLRELVSKGLLPTLRVASEYVNIADKYARYNHLEHCKIVPTWGASEAFLPEDADLLIENTETGETLAKHNLKVIDTVLESSACLIGHQDTIAHPPNHLKVKRIIDVMKKGC